MLKNRLIALFCILGSAVLIGVRGGTAAYILFYTSVLVPVFSLLYVGYVYQHFCIYQQIEQKTVVKGERIPYTFRLANEDKVPYFRVSVEFFKDYSAVERVDMGKSYYLLSGEGVSSSSVLTCSRRGEYPAGISRARVTDYFSLFSITYAIETRIEMTVYPRIVRLESFAYAPEHTEEKAGRADRQARQEIPDSELRRYADGDSMRRIHWKATAASGRLMSRLYTEESRHMVCLLADFSPMKEAGICAAEAVVLEDKLLEAVLSVADYLVRSCTEVRVLYGVEGAEGACTLDIRTEGEMEEWYQICCETRFQAAFKPEEVLKAAAASIPAYSHFMLFTAKLSGELYESQRLLKKNGTGSTVFYIGREREDEGGLLELFKEDFGFVKIPFDTEPVPVLEGRA